MDLLLTPDVRLDSEVRVKAFDFGVLSICWEVPIPEDWSQLVADSYMYIDSDHIAEQSRKLLEDLHPALVDSVDHFNENALMEDYTIFYISRFEEPVTAEVLLEQGGTDIVSIVRGESKALSKWEQQHVLEKRISYFEDDLVVMAWNSSFIYDPEGSSEHVDILEFANSELLELRSYDQLLDQALKEIYDQLEGLPKSRWMAWLAVMQMPIFKSPYHHTTQKLLTLLIDVAELTDRIENSLKIIGDLYLARIYQQISELLHLSEWQGRVDGKLASARQIYETLNSELAEKRSIFLEIIVIVLIAIEVVPVFFPGGHH